MIVAWDAPPGVRKAVLFLGAATLVRGVDAILLFTEREPETAALYATFLKAALVLAAAYGLLIVLAANRMRWARHALVALLAFSVATAIAYVPADYPPWWDIETVLVAFVLEGFGIDLLYRGPGAKWYRRDEA